MEVKVHQLVFFILVVFLLKITVGDSWRHDDKAHQQMLDRKLASKIYQK